MTKQNVQVMALAITVAAVGVAMSDALARLTVREGRQKGSARCEH